MNDLHSANDRYRPQRVNGYMPLEHYGAIGDGRSVALVAADGSIDWWCVPQLDAPPFFARLLDAGGGGHFALTPVEPFECQRQYRSRSNVLETLFVTQSGTVKLTESLNSGGAGRLPWSELARRIEGVEGTVEIGLELSVGSRFGTATPWIQNTPHGDIIHLDGITAMLRHDPSIRCDVDQSSIIRSAFTIETGQRRTIALVATENEPLLVTSLEEIDQRIDASDEAWRIWTDQLSWKGDYASEVHRSVLALKLLLFSPSGAIAAAATSSLPERDGVGDGNYDYRFAWVRDAAYTIRAFIRVNAQSEVQGALAWLLKAINEHGPEIQIFYSLDGELCGDAHDIDLPGYRNNGPVREGNDARGQKQLSLYGDIITTVALFVSKGNVLDIQTGRLMSDLADRCADDWIQCDSSIWELPEQRHYTISKVGCWAALTSAVQLATDGHIDATHVERWRTQADRIRDWIDEHCWNEQKQSYVESAGSNDLDAAMLLAVAFGFERPERLELTVRAIERELGVRGLLYRHSASIDREAAFLACSFWLVEAKALLGHVDEAHRDMRRLLSRTEVNMGLMNEMMDPKSGAMVGNGPQGLSHLALVHAAAALASTTH